MGTLEKLLVKQGWQQVGGGHWINPELDGGEQRYSLEGAVAREHERLVSNNYRLQDILNKTKSALGLDTNCQHKEIPALISGAKRVSEVREALADGRQIILGIKPDNGCACLSCDPEGKKRPRPFCPDCQVPMTNTSDALGGNPRFMCEKCGRTEEATVTHYPDTGETKAEDTTFAFNTTDGRRLEVTTKTEKGPADEVKEVKNFSEARELFEEADELADGSCLTVTPTLKQTWHAMLANRRAFSGLEKEIDALEKEVHQEINIGPGTPHVGLIKRFEAIDGDITGIRSCIETLAVNSHERMTKLEDQLGQPEGYHISQLTWKKNIRDQINEISSFISVLARVALKDAGEPIPPLTDDEKELLWKWQK